MGHAARYRQTLTPSERDGVRLKQRFREIALTLRNPAAVYVFLDQAPKEQRAATLAWLMPYLNRETRKELRRAEKARTQTVSAA